MKNIFAIKIHLLLAVLFFLALPTTGALAQSTPPLLINQLLYAEIPNFAVDPSQMVKLNYGDLNGTNSEIGTQWSIKLDTDDSSYTTGDFNNDGLSDIAVTITARGGGTGNFYYLVLFENNNGTPQYVTAQGLGDRIDVNKITYSRGVFSVDIITQGPNDPMCCGTLHKILQFKIKDGSLMDVSDVPPSSSTEDTNNDWFGIIGVIILIGIVRASWANRNKNKTSNTHSHNYSDGQNVTQNQTKERRPKNDPEMKSMYKKVIHKYHPDFARGEEDKKFRTDLTAKLNRAYEDGDIETIRLFQ
jgi:hypothetical protein